VLVCEDDPGVGAFVRVLLEREGYRVLVVGTGEEALRLSRDRHPAAMLLDLSLPGISGQEVLRALREVPETRRLPVVVLTGAGEDSGLDLEEIVGWVKKPIDRDTLLQTVHWACTAADDRCHLLLVEANEDLAGVIVEQMRGRGLRCSHARTGREAIEASRRLKYDLLVLDPKLADVDGSEVVDWLRRHNRHRNVPVLIYTSREIDDAERDHLRLGPTEFLVKGRVATDHLERRIVAMLEIYRNYQL
jgi:CheY-like chemotaxis protein